MNKAFNHLSRFNEGILGLLFNRNIDSPRRDNTETHRAAFGRHFNDGEDEEGPGLAFRGAVGFVATRFFATMTLANRREDKRYDEWAKENKSREKSLTNALAGFHLAYPEPEFE